jgi:hypothetical protein
MKHIKRRVPFLVVMLLLSAVWLAAAQEDCPAMIAQAIDSVGEVCSGIGRNQVCYGNNSLTATTWDSAPLPNFALPGDLSNVLDLATLQTAPLDTENNTWGVAMMSLQANLPDTLPGQNVTFIIFGDAELKTDSSTDSRYNAPMQAFRLTTGIGQPECTEAPRNGVLVQSPQGTTVNFLVNGVELEIGSTAFMTLKTETELDVSTLQGKVAVTSAGETKVAMPGTWIATAEGGLPSDPTPYTLAKVGRVPLNLLPEPVTIPVPIPGTSDWVDTTINVTTGQSFTLTAWGAVNPCVNASRSVCVPHGPEGIVEIGTVAQADPGRTTTYPMSDAIIAALVGRIGDGAPFYVGTGGTFIADGEGTLQFRINDSPLENNDGSFFVEISTKNGIPTGEVIGLLDCGANGGVTTPTNQPLVFRGGWAEFSREDLMTFVSNTPPSLTYDGRATQVIAVVGPDSWTDPSGNPGFQMNWYWRIAAPTPDSHEVVWTIGDTTLTCIVNVEE